MLQQQQQQQQPPPPPSQQQHSRSSTSDDDSGCALEEYAWCPPGLKAEQVRQFFKCFPEDKVPFLNSIGEKYRTRMLEEQLPPHDSDPKYCRSLSEDEKNELKIFSEQQRHNALGRGAAKQLPLTQSPVPCLGCQKSIDSGSPCVYAERAGRNGFWHPQCFVCVRCKEFLVNLIYFYKDGQLYCGRHHAELYKPRCSACDEIIFSDECTEAEGYSWHMDHFCCSNCQKRLGGERYVMRQSQPFCLTCFETMYAEYCDTCGERIETDQAQMAHESQHWHATDSCFYCYTCRLPLQNRGFFPRYGALFCSNECALQRNNRCLSGSKSIPQQQQQQQQPVQHFDKGPDIIPTSFTHANQHVRILPPRPRNGNEENPTTQLKSSLRGNYSRISQPLAPRSISSRPKEHGGYVSDGPSGTKYKRDHVNGYMSDGAANRRYRNSSQQQQQQQQFSRGTGYEQDKPQVFLQFQSSSSSNQYPETFNANAASRQQQQKMLMARSRSREPITFYNDLNLEQLDRDGATLEIARCSTSNSKNSTHASKSSRSSLPDLSRKSSTSTLIGENKYRPINNYTTSSQDTLIEVPTHYSPSSQRSTIRSNVHSSRMKQFDSNEIMYPISRPKSVAYSMTSSQFPRSRSLNGSSRFTRQHHVRFVDEEQPPQQSDCTRSPVANCRSNYQSHRSSKKYVSSRHQSSCSSSSSSSDDDDQDDIDSVYRQYDIHGNRIRRPNNYGTKISYVDECGLGPNPSLMKKTTTTAATSANSSTKKQKQKKTTESSGTGRRKKDCIIS